MLHRTPASRPGYRTLTFSLPGDHPAGRVSVVGNFNEWRPGRTPLLPSAGGVVSASVTLPDDYVVAFRYLGENGWWFDEPEADHVDDGASLVWAVEEHPDADEAARALRRRLLSPAEAAVRRAEKRKRAAQKAARTAEKAADKADRRRRDAADRADRKRREAADKAREKARQKRKAVAKASRRVERKQEKLKRRAAELDAGTRG